MSTIHPITIEQEVKTSYLDYAMSVIVSRALPDVRDGLKPVQRRILYGMWRLHLSAGGKFAKSARIVGSIMGYYHPHGDAPIYEALARMAQDFSLRYPLIIGQGNWGSIDNDPPAAQRYTEARLSTIADQLLEEIDKETVLWKDTFDGTKKEPEFLPAKLPQLLLNGAQGIAVGMATNIPPHNLTEVADALLYLLSHPAATLDELLAFVKGPDFPTGGVIYSRDAIRQAYASGRGAIPMRAKAEIKEHKGRHYITVSQIPYQVSKADLIQEIAELVREGRIEGVQDVIDASRKDKISLVIEVKRGAQPEKVLNQLYHHTRLQRNFNMLMIALIDGIEPRLLSLQELLRSYLANREVTIRRRTEFELRQASQRAHILEGLALALSHIDEVISLIKRSVSKEEASSSLQKEFGLTQLQAKAILDMRLAHLARLEREGIIKELDEKKNLIKELELILASSKKIHELIKRELEEAKKRFGDERKTEVVSESVTEFEATDLIPNESVLVVLTHHGFIKRFSPKLLHNQGRGGMGVIGIMLEEGDRVDTSVSAMSHDVLLFFSRDGRLYQKKAYEIPEKMRTAKGERLTDFFDLTSPLCAVSVLAYPPSPTSPLFLVTMSEKGIIKKVHFSHIGRISKRGIKVMAVPPQDECAAGFVTKGARELVGMSAKGKALRFPLGEVRAMGRGATGVKGMRIGKDDRLVGLIPIEKEEDELLLITQNGFGKRLRARSLSRYHRGAGGMRALGVSKRRGFLTIALRLGSTNQHLFINSTQGKIISISAKDVPVLGRQAQGVRLMRLKEGDSVASAFLL